MEKDNIQIYKKEGNNFFSKMRKRKRENNLNKVKQYPLKFRKLKAQYRDDFQIALMACKDDVANWQFVSERLRNDKQFILKVIERNPGVMKYVDENLKNDPEFMMQAVRINGEVLYAGSLQVRNNLDIVVQATKSNADVIYYASDEIKNNPDIMMNFIKQDRRAFVWAGYELINNLDFLMEVIRLYGEDENIRASIIGRFEYNPEVSYKRADGTWTQMHKKFNNPPELLIELIKKDRKAIYYIEDRIKSKKNRNDFDYDFDFENLEIALSQLESTQGLEDIDSQYVRQLKKQLGDYESEQLYKYRSEYEQIFKKRLKQSIRETQKYKRMYESEKIKNSVEVDIEGKEELKKVEETLDRDILIEMLQESRKVVQKYKSEAEGYKRLYEEGRGR